MEDGEKKPDAGMQSGSPQKQIVYAVIAVAVVILAVVLVAKFGYNTDLLNPAGGQMSLVRQNLSYKVTPQFQREITEIPRLSRCPADQTNCNAVCVNLMTDNRNCGTCGNDCSKLPNAGNAACSNGKCVISDCNPTYGDCDKNPLNGCETDIFSNSNSCGSCGLKCPADRPFCKCRVCLTQEEHDHGGKLINGIWYPVDCTY